MRLLYLEPKDLENLIPKMGPSMKSLNIFFEIFPGKVCGVRGLGGGDIAYYIKGFSMTFCLAGKINENIIWSKFEPKITGLR